MELQFSSSEMIVTMKNAHNNLLTFSVNFHNHLNNVDFGSFGKKRILASLSRK